MADSPHRFVLRLPQGLRARVAEAAALYRRSLNAEIVARLEASLDGLPNAAIEANLKSALFPHLETALRGHLSRQEEDLVLLFRRLSARQRDALLNLLG